MARGDPDRFFDGKRWFNRAPGGTFRPAGPTPAPEPRPESPKPSSDRARLGQAIRQSAADLGVDAEDLATAISYETKGTFDPGIRGPTTRWGQHRGLLQMGAVQRRQYGLGEGAGAEAQMAAATRYLRAAGVKPGMGLLDIYSAINAGRVGRYGARDGAAGGAPGTVADKVAGMGIHRAKAVALLAEAGPGSRALAPSATPDGGGTPTTPGQSAGTTTPGGDPDATPGPATTDISHLSTYRRGAVEAVKGLIIHHAGMRGTPADVVRVMNERGLGAHYVMDRDGKVYRTLPEGARGAHIRPSEINDLSNANTEGIEVIARDDRDITPAQVEASKRFVGDLSKKHPGLKIYGHGEVNSHKQHTEGSTIVSAVRDPGTKTAKADLPRGNPAAATTPPTAKPYKATADTKTPTQNPADAKSRTKVAATTPGSGREAAPEGGERRTQVAARGGRAVPIDPSIVQAQAAQAGRLAAAESILAAASGTTPVPARGKVAAPFLERVGRSFDGAMQDLQLAALQASAAGPERRSFADT